MPLAEIMESIEQHRFSSELNLASGTKGFRRGLRANELFRKLADLATDADNRVAVARRIEELSKIEIDPRYENQYDAAISAYLTVLGDMSQPETVAKAASAASTAKNCWWTVGIARDLLVHVVATGWAEAPAATHVVPAALAQGSVRRDAMRENFYLIWASHHAASSTGDDVARRILSVLSAEQNKGQVPRTNNVIVMPLPTEEGERVVPKSRGRNRAIRSKLTYGAAAGHQRGRQLARP